MTNPTIQPGDPVPIVPQTRGHLAARFGASVLLALGAVAQALPTVAPQLHALYPSSRFVSLLLPLGFLWMAVQRALDGQSTTPVNLSPPVAPSHEIPDVPPVNRFGVPQ